MSSAPLDSPVAAAPSSVDKNHITSTELSECDREELHHIGQIQGGHTGHAIFFSTTWTTDDGDGDMQQQQQHYTIFAADQDILSIAWIKRHNNDDILGSQLHTIMPVDLYDALTAVSYQ